MSGFPAGAIFKHSIHGLLGSVLLIVIMPPHTQALPPCGFERPTTVDVPWMGGSTGRCLEQVIENREYGEIGYTGLAAIDGDLFALIPVTGELVQLRDTNDDRLPDTPHVLAGNFHQPGAIVPYGQGLLVLDGQRLYRVDATTGAKTVLQDAIPAGKDGYPNHGLWLDNRQDQIYIGTGGDIQCTPGRGAIYRTRPEANAPLERVATGVASPVGFVRIEDTLWLLDAATARLLPLTEGQDYGACSGTPSITEQIVLPASSNPTAVLAAEASPVPGLAQRLLVALGGSGAQPVLTGYEVIALPLADLTQPQEYIAPAMDPWQNLTRQKMNIQGSGFWPHRIYGMALDANGWLYISTGGSRIYAVRPAE